MLLITLFLVEIVINILTMLAILSVQSAIIGLACFCFDVSSGQDGSGMGVSDGDSPGVVLSVGHGVGLPFICAQSLNDVALKSILKDLFGTSVDLLENVLQEERLDDSQPIQCPTDLSCNVNIGSKDKAVCDWENNEKDRPCEDDFHPVVGRPKRRIRWKTMMGNNKLPDGGYFAFASRKSGFPVSLLSRVIPKQTGDGILQLKYWLTVPVTLEMCLLLETSNYKDLTKCSGMVKNSKKHIVQFKIRGPIRSNFKIVIQASNFVVDKGSVVIVDDIQYASDMCGSPDELQKCRPSQCISIE